MHTNLWIFASASTLVTFGVLLALARWLGSTQLSQLTFFNWVAGATLGNLAANMIGSSSVSSFIESGYTMVLFTAACFVAAWVALKNRFFRRVANGEPIVLIHQGKILRNNLKKSRVNLDLLMMLLRQKGYFSYSDISYGILEPSGNLSILPLQETQSVSKADLEYGPDLSEQGQGPYTELVLDGSIDQDKLRSSGHDLGWLEAQIRKHGGRGLKDVMYFAVNKQGEIIIDTTRERQTSDDNEIR